MHRALKTLLLWLIIATLPLQGLAAVTKSACGPAHHHPPSVAMVTEQHEHAEMHHGSYGGAERHHGNHADHAEVVVAGDASDAKSSDNAAHASSYCAACAACCFGAAAPPSAMLPAPEPTASESIVLSPVSLLAGHVPSTPKRPPRLAA